MNAASESAISPVAIDHESLRVLAQWLKDHGNLRVRKTDPRRLLDTRYPQGLLSDAELDALAGVWH
nr:MULTISPECIES: hypothetical protein [unclassified Pseudomonas]